MIQVFTQIINDTWLAVACTEQIFASSFADTEQKVMSKLLDKLPFNVPLHFLSSPSACAKDAFSSMAAILKGKKVKSTPNLAMDNLPKYTVMVLKAVMQIPLGYVSTYGAVAKAVGGGSRAVGNIMAGNIFVPFIPCHRVVRADLSLGGYGGGLKAKHQLLMKEKQSYLKSKKVLVENGGVLQVYPVETTLDNVSKIFSLP
ncbi:MAG: methylated-DNA--[protein]-cysteine S-methyltransferase [Nitrososphaerota archaeon]|jgi:methylated-DNA-[protein]-cysteine S-methyltransferase|nr:methylated-DNA--[protein]-cysteine S-methyltransferase [Nitrososphaerota archaeon]